MSKLVKIQVKKAFNLNVDSVLTHYGVGAHDVEESVANHAYTQFHLVDDEAASEPAEKTAEEIAAETSAIVKGLVTAEKPTPNVDTINDALKAASLPQIKAADRDAILTVTE